MMKDVFADSMYLIQSPFLQRHVRLLRCHPQEIIRIQHLDIMNETQPMRFKHALLI